MSEFKEELKASITTSQGLEEREEAFLNFLFDYCKGNIKEAMEKAGYPKDYPKSYVTKKLSKQIKDRAKEFLIASSGEAAISLVSVLSEPDKVGAKNIIASSKEILDRAGVFKEEAPQVQEIRNMFILPPKDVSPDDE